MKMHGIFYRKRIFLFFYWFILAVSQIQDNLDGADAIWNIMYDIKSVWASRDLRNIFSLRLYLILR